MLRFDHLNQNKMLQADSLRQFLRTISASIKTTANAINACGWMQNASFASKVLKARESSGHFRKRESAANTVDASPKVAHERAPRRARPRLETAQFDAGAFPDDLLASSEQLATQR